MTYKIDHDLHIHSNLSRCSLDKEQNVYNILNYAKNNNLSNICLTDHFWSNKIPIKQGWKAENFYKIQNFDYLSKNLPLPQEEKIHFLFGCEADMDENFTLGITKEDFSLFNFVVVSTTHLHMYPFISIEKTAENLVNRYNALINMNLPFSKIGIAHPTCLLIAPNGQTKDVLNLIPEQTFKNIFYKLAEKKAGIELNKTDFDLNKVTIDDIKASLRVLNIAKNCGCKFYLGSDAHHPADFLNTRDIFSNLINQLSLNENHKFTPKI